ncbi:XIAP-associated factor 1 isoform X4 [Balaenoptera acutorostrata]|uniref:XIAP-associated factor 1 isoform X4 n=1 Tax=Balaenoptera acutorostrata TaxID=9767 RepID=A0ABM3SPX6_BALAC|nr:XIAP-associated factor 1 isoform X4 [Balaenoptera acutorostrata]
MEVGPPGGESAPGPHCSPSQVGAPRPAPPVKWKGWGAPCVSRACRSTCWRVTRPRNARSAPSSASSVSWPCASTRWTSTSATAAGGRRSAQAAASGSRSTRWPGTEMSVGASRPGARKGREFQLLKATSAAIIATKRSQEISISTICQAAEDQTSTAEKDVRPKTKNTSRFPLLSEKSTRQAPRGTNKTTDLPLKSDGRLRASSPVEDETAYDILRRCSQCGILLPLPTLTQHQEKCWWLASSKGKQVRSSS